MLTSRRISTCAHPRLRIAGRAGDAVELRTAETDWPVDLVCTLPSRLPKHRHPTAPECCTMDSHDALRATHALHYQGDADTLKAAW